MLVADNLEQKKLLKISEVARELGVSAPTVRRLIDDGALQTVTVRMRQLVKRESLEAYIKRNS